MVGKFFGLKEKQTNVKTEFVAGATTFLTMAYIIFVNPNILSAAGMDKQALIIVTCIVSAIITIITGLFANAPIAMAPGMGLNAFLSYSLVMGGKITWQTALGSSVSFGTAVFCADTVGFEKTAGRGDSCESDFGHISRYRIVYHVYRLGQYGDNC